MGEVLNADCFFKKKMGRLELESTLLPWRIIRSEGRRETRHTPPPSMK